MRQKAILLVDDHPSIRSGVGLILEKSGFCVYQSDDGPGARDILRSHSIDLALLDVQLQSEDGIPLAAELRQAHPRLALAILSMHSDLNRVRAALRSGVNGYLLKQAEAQEVVAACQVLVFGGFYLDPRVAGPILEQLRESPQSRQENQAERRQFLLQCLKSNLNNQELSQQLQVSVSTVKTLLRELYAEYEVNDRRGLLLKISHSDLLQA